MMSSGFSVGQFVIDVRDNKKWLVISSRLVDGQVVVVPCTGYMGVISHLIVENLVGVVK